MHHEIISKNTFDINDIQLLAEIQENTFIADSLKKLNDNASLMIFLSENKIKYSDTEFQIKQKSISKNIFHLNDNSNKKTSICRTIKGSYFWNRKLSKLEDWVKKSNMNGKYENLLTRTKEKIDNFKRCKCKKCKHELQNTSLQKILNLINYQSKS